MRHVVIIGVTTMMSACQDSAPTDPSTKGISVNTNALKSASNQQQNSNTDTTQLWSVNHHWPMFSGPNGSGQISGDFSAPTSWSVRQNDKVLWQTELPAGGQSGLSVWGDNVFLTINKPLDTPKYSTISYEFEKAKISYQLHSEYVINSVKNEDKYKELVANIDKSKEAWDFFLTKYKQDKSEKLSGVQLKRAIKKSNTRKPVSQSYYLRSKCT